MNAKLDTPRLETFVNILVALGSRGFLPLEAQAAHRS
jgi:hypothetical protein